MNLSKLTYFSKLLPLLSFRGNTGVVSKKSIKDTLFFLKKDLSFRYETLVMVSGLDTMKSTQRLCVSYELLSYCYNHRLRVKTFVNEGSSVETVTKVYPNSDWWEREVWDMFGILFKGHSDLRRILTDYGFEGHPLKKDFPLVGFFECYYSDRLGCVKPRPVSLSQELRRYKTTGSLSVDRIGDL